MHGAVVGFTTVSITVIANGAVESSVKTVSRREAVMTDEQIIMTAMHVNDSTRDAIRWAMKQVRMQANTHQLPSVSEQNTHQPDAVVRQPLTDDEINGLQLPESGTGTIRDLVRVVELAHGIGGSDE